jgi:hypothetical protein
MGRRWRQVAHAHLYRPPSARPVRLGLGSNCRPNGATIIQPRASACRAIANSEGTNAALGATPEKPIPLSSVSEEEGEEGEEAGRSRPGKGRGLTP